MAQAGAVCAAAASLVLGLWIGGGGPWSRLAQITDAGQLTGWGLPIFRLGVDLSALGTIGMLVTAILLPRTGHRLGDTARRCLRSAVWLALSWAATTALLLVLAWSDATGRPVSGLSVAHLLARDDPLFPEAGLYLSAAAVALVVAGGAAVTETVYGAAFLTLLCAYNLIPLTAEGHDGAIESYAVSAHVIAVSLWVGGLAGLMIHVRRASPLLIAVVPRFSKLALICFFVVGGSGLVAALAELGSGLALFQTRFGLLVVAKAAALIALGTAGWWHREWIIPALGQRPGAFIRLAVVELVVMAAAVALGVALAQAALPGQSGDSPATHGHAAVRGPAALN